MEDKKKSKKLYIKKSHMNIDAEDLKKKKKTSKLNQTTYKKIYKPGGRFITGVQG